MRKLLILVLTVAMLLTAVAAFAEQTSADLVFVVSDEIQGTDMHQISWENLVHTLIYTSLVVMDETNTNPVPSMVENVSVENDGKDIVMTIPEGLTFSNGDPVTPEAIVENFNRYIKVSIYASDFDPVDSIEAVNNTVVFHCEQSAPFLWAVLASNYTGLVDVAAIEAAGSEESFNHAAVTYGPYMVEEWQQGQQIILKRNESYKNNNPYVQNDGAPYPERITIRFISDDYTRVNELLSGSVDYIDAVPAANLVELEAAPNIEIAKTYQAGCSYLLINTEDPILSDYNVRLAIAKALNREELCVAQDNTIIPADGFLTPAQIGYSESSATELKALYAYDLEGAIQLLADAGWTDTDGDGYADKDGQKLTLNFLVPNDYTALKNAAPVMQYQLKAIGVEAVISELEGSAIKIKAQNGEHQLALRKYAWADADMLTNLFGTSSGYYSDETIDALLDEARYISDGTERAAKYHEAQLAIFNQLPGVPVVYEIQYSAYLDSLKGVAFTSTGAFLIDDVYK